jgi:hypothetical protein
MRTFRLVLIIPVILIITNAAQAQIANDYMVGISADLIKTDTDGMLKKVQAGAEFNYFLHRKVTVTGGFELWTDDEIGFVIGGRWFPTEDFFVRARGLVGINDVNIGGGWTQPLGEHFKFEAIGDFYFQGHFAIRAGINYVFRKKMVSRE